MLDSIKKYIWKQFTSIDARLKFPNLKPGKIGIQLGFDMAYPITSDLFTMYRRVDPCGKVIGIDPDPNNHSIACEIIRHQNLNIELIQKGTYSEKGKSTFLLGDMSSWNQLGIVPKDTTVSFRNESIEVDIDTLENIVNGLTIDKQQIAHINMTINGAEYATLLGASSLLLEINDLSLTVIAGRYDESGTIEGKSDYEVIIPFLKTLGFRVKFKRMHQLFWWGFITRLIMNRRWIYGKKNFGVIMASKGKHRIKWYQSFS